MPTRLTARQQEILEASLQVIDRDGLKRFTMKNIAQEIGVTDAALYKHFADKGAIFRAIADLFKAATLDILTEIRLSADLNALQKLEMFIKGRARQFQANRALTVVLFSDELFRGVAQVDSLNADTMENHGRLLSEIVYEGQRENSIRADISSAHIILIMTGAMRLMVNNWKTQPAKQDLVTMVESFWETFMRLVAV